MAGDLKSSESADADPLLGVAAWAGGPPSRGVRTWRLPLIRTFAAAVIVVAVAYRVWEANLPRDVLQGEGVVIGAGILTMLILQTRKGRFSAEYMTPIDVAGLYWHFVDIIWIFLFPLLYLIDRHMK